MVGKVDPLVKDLQRVSKRASSSELGVGVVPKTIDERRQWSAGLGPTDRDRLSGQSGRLQAVRKIAARSELNRLIDLGNRIYASARQKSYCKWRAATQYS